MNGSAYGILLIRSLSIFKLYIKRLNSYKSFKINRIREKLYINCILFFFHCTQNLITIFVNQMTVSVHGYGYGRVA